MDELGFRSWMNNKGIDKKLQSDYVSRIKRIEREIDNCDIDEQYRSDRCEYLKSLFAHMGDNDEMKKYPNAVLPIGKYYMSTYRYALKQYIQFRDEILKVMPE